MPGSATPFKRLVGAFAAIGFVSLSLPMPAQSGTALWISTCQGGRIPMPIGQGNGHDPAKPCPFACHALCTGQRKHPGLPDEDGAGPL